jgi:hypothetical protein
VDHSFSVATGPWWKAAMRGGPFRREQPTLFCGWSSIPWPTTQPMQTRGAFGEDPQGSAGPDGDDGRTGGDPGRRDAPPGTPGRGGRGGRRWTHDRAARRLGANPRAVAADHARRYGADVAYVYEHAVKGYAATFRGSGASDVARDGRVRLVEPDQVVAANAVSLRRQGPRGASTESTRQPCRWTVATRTPPLEPV